MNVPERGNLGSLESSDSFSPRGTVDRRSEATAGAIARWGLAAIALFGTLGFAACSRDAAQENPVDPAQGSDRDSPEDKQKEKALDPADPKTWTAQLDPGPITKSSLREHDLGQVWVIDPEHLDEPRKLPIEQAEARGYTVVDLGDDWRPYIFTHKTPGVTDESHNDYADRYVALANDRTDADGEPLAEHEHNYLELYGIPPSLGVVLEEWRALPEVEKCLTDAGYDGSKLDVAVGTIAYSKGKGQKRLRAWKAARGSLAKKMRKAGLVAEADAENWAAAKGVDDIANTYANFAKLDGEVQVIRNAQIRFRCEKLFNEYEGAGKFDLGDFDGYTHHALANFEKKHDIMGWGHFTAENIGHLALSPREAVHARLVRVLTERVVSAAGIVEDGSARDWKPDFTYTDKDGQTHALRDLTSELTAATLAALDLGDPETALARLEALHELATPSPEQADGFGRLLVAVRLPELPAYYSDDMDFSVVIDRGDVWYDFPWDEQGNQAAQPRERVPRLTLYVNYEGQKIPLVHWRTTIGSWRSEQHDGKEYYAYKNSDVGERVWKTIMAAPVWIPPESTPTASLTKLKRSKGKLRRMVNYDETGPGYMSAYGLVAAYHVKLFPKNDGTVTVFDNQIRTHGSVDYMSILRRYSHGCHRLYNMNAVRMFSMILQHRDYQRVGQTKIGAGRTFETGGKSYTMKLTTRGYQFELAVPIPVEVTEGRIRGRRRTPVDELMPKPGVDYSATEGELVDPSIPPTNPSGP